MMGHRRKHFSRPLRCETLESRCVLSTVVGELLGANAGGSDFHAVIVAGDPNGSPADSPAERVDANEAGSAFTGVGSLRINTRRGAYICTATPIDATRVLTAAHCVDINNDGRSNSKDGIQSVYFQLNVDADEPTDQIDYSIKASGWTTHPDYTGFNRPSVNDDLAVIKLSQPLPAGVPAYELATTPMAAGTHIYLVGYGRSGDGVSGYTTDASWTIKRSGENHADAFYGQDDAGKAVADEVFRFDFDGPSGNGSFGGPTLGNQLETTLGGGDSGGPSFVLIAGQDPLLASSYQLIGVNTFTQGLNAPQFGSLGGGIHVVPYLDWISAADGSPGTDDGGTGKGGPKGKSALGIRVATLPLIAVGGSSLASSPWSSPGAPLADFAAASESRQGAALEAGQLPAALLSFDLPRVALPAGLETDDNRAEDRDALFAEDLDSLLEDWSAAVEALDDSPSRA